MKNKVFTKRILVVALSIIMVLGLLPIPAYAYLGDGGAILTSNDPGEYDMNGRPLLVYVTPNGGYVSRTSGGNDDSTQQFTATANNGWVFSEWRTYYQGPSSNAPNPNHTWDSEWCFSKPGDSESKPNNNSATIQVNREWDAKGTYYLYAIFKPKVTFSTGYNRVSISASSVFATAEKNIESYVNYNDTASFSAAMGGRTDISITVNGKSFTDFQLRDGWDLVFSITITGPTNIIVNSRARIQNVHFDANGGIGTMSAQTFNYDEAQALTANSFTKTGYTFAGWNTKADGIGTAYADKQSIVFTPVNDGDSITLYAQWTECNNHTWTNGECTDCGTACSHFGGTATCTDQAICSECGMKYGDVKEHKFVYSASSNIITETCEHNCAHNATATLTTPSGTLVYDGAEKNATASYSDSWQGDKLSVIYEPDNINAGDVTAKITIGGATALVNYTIDKAKPIYTLPTDISATYGNTLADVTLPTGWSWKDSATSVGHAGTNTFKAIFTPANTDNYTTAEADVSVTVEPKEIGINWDTIEFTYLEGKAQAPTALATGVINGDQIALAISGAEVNAGSYTATVIGITGEKAANYKLPSNVTTAFTIKNASQTAPVLTSVNETIYGKADGKITGVDSTMEYRKDGQSVYTAIDGTALTDLAAGQYYVRYAATTNYNASADTKVTITSGKKLTVTIPQKQNGYTLTVDKTAFEYMGGFNITFSIAEGYSKAENFAVKLNDKDMQWGDFNEIGVQSCTTDTEITVEGVVLKTYTVTYTDENGTVKTVKVEHGKKPEIPQVPVKDGYTVTWEEVPNAIIGDITIKAVYTPIPTTDSPQTGDNSNMALWITLLFISGGTVITLTVYDKKEKKYGQVITTSNLSGFQDHICK